LFALRPSNPTSLRASLDDAHLASTLSTNSVPTLNAFFDLHQDLHATLDRAETHQIFSRERCRSANRFGNNELEFEHRSYLLF
jgi:hypothetical protein